jgi:hypothetical protein
MQHAATFDPVLIGGDLWPETSKRGPGDQMLYEPFSGPNASRLNFLTRLARHPTPLEPFWKGDSLLKDWLIGLMPGIILLILLYVVFSLIQYYSG